MTQGPVARRHAAAVLAWFPAQTNPLTVFNEKGPGSSQTGPYAVIYASPGMRENPSIVQDYRRVTTTHQLSLFGGTPDEVLWAADKAADILGAVLTITGRYAYPVRYLGSTQVTRDDTTRTSSGTPLFTATTDIAVTSTTTT